jgi:hypothetical protein
VSRAGGGAIKSVAYRDSSCISPCPGATEGSDSFRNIACRIPFNTIRGWMEWMVKILIAYVPRNIKAEAAFSDSV